MSKMQYKCKDCGHEFEVPVTECQYCNSKNIVSINKPKWWIYAIICTLIVILVILLFQKCNSDKPSSATWYITETCELHVDFDNVSKNKAQKWRFKITHQSDNVTIATLKLKSVKNEKKRYEAVNQYDDSFYDVAMLGDDETYIFSIVDENGNDVDEKSITLKKKPDDNNPKHGDISFVKEPCSGSITDTPTTDSDGQSQLNPPTESHAPDYKSLTWTVTLKANNDSESKSVSFTITGDGIQPITEKNGVFKTLKPGEYKAYVTIDGINSPELQITLKEIDSPSAPISKSTVQNIFNKVSHDDMTPGDALNLLTSVAPCLLKSSITDGGNVIKTLEDLLNTMNTDEEAYSVVSFETDSSGKIKSGTLVVRK